jgi:hypothetical protein
MSCGQSRLKSADFALFTCRENALPSRARAMPASPPAKVQFDEDYTLRITVIWKGSYPAQRELVTSPVAFGDFQEPKVAAEAYEAPFL